MRNNFGTKEKSDFGFDAENGQAASPDQLAVVWSGEQREVVVASPIPGDASGSYDLDVARFPANFNLAAALKMRRASSSNLAAFSEQTIYLTAVSDFSERTRILALSGDVLALNDDELVEWLMSAEQQMLLGTDNHPVFETALEDTACTVRRLPNGQVAMTEVPRQHIQAMREKMRSLIGEDAPAFINLTIETPLRCAARYFLTALPEGAVVLRGEKRSEVTAFLLVGKAGFSYGLWSPATGLFSEYAFHAPAELNRLPPSWDDKSGGGFSYETASAGRRPPEQTAETSPGEATQEVVNRRDERLENYVRDAFDQLFLQLSPEKLEQLELSNYAQIVWTAEIGLSDVIAPIAAEYSANTGLDFFQLPAPSDEAVAGGLLFGSFTFGDATAAGAEIVPPVNLARDILALADKEEIERRRIEEIYSLKRRSRAVFSLLAPVVLVVASLLAITADYVRSQIMLGVREIRADARTLELKPALDRRKSYEANLKWYQEFITQVSGLRRQQPVGIGMLYELNSSYPFNIDPSFYVADLKLGNTGATARSAAPAAGAANNANCFDCVEIRGLARNKDAVTSFLRSLEFTGGPESGTRLFSNLAYEVQETTAPTAVPTGNQPSLPAMSGSNLTNTNTAPGVIVWSIKGNYMPMAPFAPPLPPDKNKPPAPPAAAAPTPAPAAAANTAKPAS